MLSFMIPYNLSLKGDRVRYALDKSGHTPSSAAKTIGCKPQAIFQWISGATDNIKNELLYRLADLTGFEARWIALGEGPEQAASRAITHTVSVMTAMSPEQQYLAARLIDQISEPSTKEGTG